MTAEDFLNQSDSPTGKQLSASAFLDEEPVGTSIGDTLQKTAADLEMSIADIPLALGEAFSGLTKTVPASYYAAKEGLVRPDQYSKESIAAFDTQREYFKKLEQEAATRKTEGRSTAAGEAIRGAGQSLGFTVGGMAPSIVAGGLTGLAVGAAFPPAEAATVPIGVIASGVMSMAASAPVSYRMAGGQFLYDAFKSLEENKGRPLTEEEKTKAYDELLPIAQNTALWEAGPEAIGNAVQLGALKYAFGFGKKAATDVAGKAIKAANDTLLKKVGAVAGAQAIELGGETITQMQQGPDQAKMEQYVQTGSTAGAANEYQGLAGAVKAFKEVAPTTLALGAITAGAGGVVKVAGMGGKEVGKVLFTQPKTPEQIAEDQINDASNRVANDLSISPDDTQANNLNQQIKALSQVQEIRKQTLAAIEPTSREAQTLKLDIAEGETMLGELNQNLTKLTGLSEPITEAEKQQIELAKAITAPAPEVAAPVTEAITPPAEVVPTAPVAEVAPAPTEPTIKETLPVAQEAPAITPTETGKELALSETQISAPRSLDAQNLSLEELDQITQGGKIFSENLSESISNSIKNIGGFSQGLVDKTVGSVKIGTLPKIGTLGDPFTEALAPYRAAVAASEKKRKLANKQQEILNQQEKERRKELADILAKMTISAPVAETPAVTEAPAAEVAPIQRDATKPEQMTEEEFLSSNIEPQVHIVNQTASRLGVSNIRDIPLSEIHKQIINDKVGYINQAIDLAKNGIMKGISKKKAKEVGNQRLSYAKDYKFSASAVDSYGITLPEGYTKQGDLYIYQPAVSETITPAAGISVGNRIKLGKSPQTYIVEQVVPQSEVEKANDEQFYSVKSEKTGEVQVVEKADMKQVGGKKVRKLFAGEKANIPQFMRDSLDTARAMAAAGKTSEEIRSVTGWFSGKYDGKMRWEIPDQNAKLTTETFLRNIGEPSFEAFIDKYYNILKNQGFQIVGKLSDILDHKELYDLYPDLKNIQVEIVPLKGKSVAAFIAEKPRTEISFGNPNTIILNAKNFPKDIKSVLLHEIQHAIQNKEGFAKGGSSKEFGKKYTKLAGEIEARDIQARKDLTSEQLAVIAPYSSENIAPEDAIIIQGEGIAESIQQDEVVTPIPEANRYTFKEAVKAADAHFGKQGIPEGVVIVNNTTDPDLEMKAGYFVNRGQIVINLAYIAKGENLGDIIDHELGHYIFGDPEFQADFKQFWDLMTPEEKAKADQIISQFYNKETGAIQMEEKQVRAFMQLIQDSKAMPKWKQLLDKIKRWINEKLGTNLQVNDRGALAVLAAAHKRFKSGEQIVREIDSGVLKMAAEPAGKPKLGEKGGILIPTKEDFIQAGQNIYEAGMEFGTWAKQMIQQFGDVVREFLGDVWQAVSGAPAKLNELMGYLPKKGETGALSVGKTGKLDRYTDKGTIVKLAIKQEKDTPKGILSETIKIIKQRVFDGDSTPSESATKKAWGLIERLKATNPDSKNNAEAINQLTRETMQEVDVAEDATEGERQAFETIKQTVGMSKLRNELYKYAIKLSGQGDDSMLKYLLNNKLNIVGTSLATEEDIARTLGALAGLKSYIVQANEAEQAGFIQLAAQRFFNTTTPTEDQIAKIKRIFTAVNETKVNEEEAILDELTQVGEKIGTELVENINTQIDKASKPEVKDPMVAAITAMLKLGGTFVYKKTKNKIKAAVEKTIKGGITNYREKLIVGAANGLETGFWKTLSSQENKSGPLGELDSAQNRELGNIVKSTLVSMKLQGKPPNTKMSIYEQVASILGEKPLSQDKIKLADEKIRGEINSKRQNELEQTEDQDVKDAINLKYDQIENTWDMAMSQQLDMPVSDAMLRRLIFNELKEGKTSIAKLATLMNEEPTIGASRQDRIVSSIINKIAGVTFEGQNPADYTTLKEYLSNQLESLVQEKQTEKKVVKTKEKVKANQAQTELDKLVKIQSDTPNFPTSEKIANPVRDAVRNALKLNLNVMFDPKAAADIMRNWKKEFAAELQQLGVDETTALTLTDVVGRQIELDSVSKNLDAIDNAINKGALSGVINAIKNTPLADQQKPDWRYEVMRDYLRSAGLPMAQAEKIAKLMDISLQKRFAKAQEEAAASIANTILKGIKPESNRGFTALIQAIRAQVLNPGSNVATEFGRAMGWKGFTAEQLKALNEFDSKINDETITEAERAVALEGIKKIIDKVSLPTKVRDALSAFYIGQALGRLTVASVQVVDPIIFSAWDAAVASARNITSPSQVMQIWGNYVSSIINAGRELAFSFKNDVTRSGRLVDYLETQDRKLKRLINDANNLWKNGQYKQAIKKYLFGYPEITSRVLKALDDASFSLLEQNALNQYMISAMNMAKIPKKKQLGTLRMIAQARQMDIADMRANGISKNDAIIYANERMKAEISRVMSGLNLNSTEIIDSAINDSLARIGKTRFKEQFSGETEIKDKGTLSFLLLKFYEKISKSTGKDKGVEGELSNIFQRILFGFPTIVARVANVAYGYTPLSLYRHLLTGRYPLTYGTAIQRRKRFVEQLAGTAVLLPLWFLRSMSFDDDEEKSVRVVITGFGPIRSKDPEAYNQWHKKHNPGSLEIFIGDKRIAIDSKSAGPLRPMIDILGAIDDWEIRKFQDNAKMTKEELKKAQENAGLLSTLGEIAGSFALTAARRGPATGVMQGLIDFRRYPDDPIAAIAQETSFSLIPLIPILGFGAIKNASDFLSEPIDTRTKEGAILNNLPIIGPMFGKPAINAFGQPIGDVEISEKIKRSIGIPITLVPVSSGDDQKLAKITLKNANGPEPLQRNWFDTKFETPLSDQEWRTVNEDYARSNRKTVLENYEELNGFDPEIYKTAISNVGTASKYRALDNLYKARKKP